MALTVLAAIVSTGCVGPFAGDEATFSSAPVSPLQVEGVADGADLYGAGIPVDVTYTALKDYSDARAGVVVRQLAGSGSLSVQGDASFAGALTADQAVTRSVTLTGQGQGVWSVAFFVEAPSPTEQVRRVKAAQYPQRDGGGAGFTVEADGEVASVLDRIEVEGEGPVRFAVDLRRDDGGGPVEVGDRVPLVATVNGTHLSRDTVLALEQNVPWVEFVEGPQARIFTLDPGQRTFRNVVEVTEDWDHTRVRAVLFPHATYGGAVQSEVVFDVRS